jgi:uncharacterized protein YndB with AHSA1/START domain
MFMEKLAEKENLIATISVMIDAPAERVWNALTDPELIKQYLFGTQTITDWKKGSDIRFKGQWEGKSYEDKGKIININPNKFLHYTYWSSMSQLEDKPENYKNVVFELREENNQTLLKLTQDNNDTEESRKHSEQNWKTVLDGLKKVVEKK